MSVGSRLMAAITPLIREAAPQVYTGKALEYATYNISSWPDLYAESEPGAIQRFVQVHIYLPHGRDPEEKLDQMAEALLRAGFTYPSVTDASDSEGQHFVLECRDAEGRGYGET